MARGDPRQRLVVVGNGMAGCRAIEEILKRDADRFAITVFGAEPRVNYNRIMLSPVLAGDKAFDEIVINGLDWYADNDITLLSGDPVVAIDRATKTVTARSGAVVGYDVLVLATGSTPFVMPVPGVTLPGVVTFRDMDDVETMVAAADRGGRAVGHRRRTARSRGGARALPARHARHRRPSDGPSDGAPTR